MFGRLWPIFLCFIVFVGCRLDDNRVDGSIGSEVVDKIAPTSPTSPEIGNIPVSLEESPTFTWSDSTDAGSGLSHYEGRVLRVPDASYVTDWVSIENGQALTGLASALNSTQIYQLEIRAVDLAGNRSDVVTSPAWIPGSDGCYGDALNDSPFANSSSGGDGLSAATAFKICVPEQMNRIGSDTSYLDKYFSLAADLDLSDYTGTQFNRIGSNTNRFTGEFDGNGRIIHNFTYSDSTAKNVGLFGYVEGPAVIKDLELVNGLVEGEDFVGLMVGYIYQDVTISGCKSSGTVTGTPVLGVGAGGLIGYQFSSFGRDANLSDISSSATVSGEDGVGGLVGELGQRAIVTNSWATGNVSGVRRVGGVVGFGYYTTFTNTYTTGSVTATGNDAGGLLGYTDQCSVYRSYATGDVSSSGQNVGGLIGRFESTVQQVEDSFASGDVSGGDYTGGLVGYLISNVRRCYTTGAVQGQDFVGGLVGEIGDSSAEITASFSVGSVSGSSATNAISRTFNNTFGGTVTGNYYASNSSCTNASGSCTDSGTGVDISVQPGYFQSSSNAPLTNWDFTSIWIEESATYPTLR